MTLNHGDFEVSVDGNIIIVELKGSFNEYGAKALTEQIKATIETFAGAPFSIAVNDLALEGITPEAYEQLNNYNSWLNGQNMRAKAMIVAMDVFLKIDDARIPAKSQQNIQNFKSLSAAIKWLKSQDYSKNDEH